jgi:predicted transposase YbfD/YdcC
VSSSPIVLAAGQLAVLGRNAAETADAVPDGLLEALARVPDPRDPRGIRYELAPVLALAVCAMLAGARSYAAIAEWAADIPARVRAGLGLPRGAVPDLATIWRVLTSVDPAALDAAAGSWVSARLAAARAGRRRVVLAVDGKTVRGARAADGTAPHLMACLDHATGTVLAQVAVDGKTNEITMLAGLLDQVSDLDGVLVTMDALHAQRDHAAYLHKRGGHYLVTVKGNQPGLLTRLRSLPWKDVPPGHVSQGRAHGRTEKRIIKVVTVKAGLGFPQRRPGHPDHPPHPPERLSEMEDRDQLRHHQPARRQGPPRPARRMDPGSLEDREPAALGTRCHLRRRPLPGQDRHRPARHGHLAQPGHQHLAPGRPHWHRHRTAPQRTRPDPCIPPGQRPQVTGSNETMQRPWDAAGQAAGKQHQQPRPDPVRHLAVLG